MRMSRSSYANEQPNTFEEAIEAMGASEDLISIIASRNENFDFFRHRKILEEHCRPGLEKDFDNIRDIYARTGLWPSASDLAPN